MPPTSHLLADTPPTPQDYATDLASRLARYRADSIHIPTYALDALAVATRRALHAEATIALLRACNDIGEVWDTIDSSTIPV